MNWPRCSVSECNVLFPAEQAGSEADLRRDLLLSSLVVEDGQLPGGYLPAGPVQVHIQCLGLRLNLETSTLGCFCNDLLVVLLLLNAYGMMAMIAHSPTSGYEDLIRPLLMC